MTFKAASTPSFPNLHAKAPYTGDLTSPHSFQVGRVENGDEDDEQLAIQAPPEATLAFAPQLELVDGKLVPKAQSLTVQAQAEPSHRRVREYSNVVNNASYTNRAPNERWSAEETEAFYNVSTQMLVGFV